MKVSTPGKRTLEFSNGKKITLSEEEYRELETFFKMVIALPSTPTTPIPPSNPWPLPWPKATFCTDVHTAAQGY